MYIIYTVVSAQKRIKLEAWWPGYSYVKQYLKRCKKCKELRNFTQTTFMAQRNGPMESCAYGSCIHY